MRDYAVLFGWFLVMGYIGLCAVLLVGCHPFVFDYAGLFLISIDGLVEREHLGTLVPVGTSEVRLPLTCFCLGLLLML
jgi:hypothetical protein